MRDDEILDIVNENQQRGAKKRRHSYLWLFLVVFFVSVAAIVTTIFAVSAVLKKLGQNEGLVETEPPVVTDAPAPIETVPPETEPAVALDYIERGEADMHLGNLIVVNAGHEYVFPERPALISVYAGKTNDYQVASTEIYLDKTVIASLNAMFADFKAAKGLTDVNLTNGYRDYNTQMSLYSNYVGNYGVEAAEGYVAMGGYSEHHTALGFDLGVYTADGVSTTLDSAAAYSWIYDNCHKYGFVRRFDPEKTLVTGIMGESYHFRYVGKPHAYYMKKNSLVLEEYIETLKKYPADGEHLTFADDEGGRWEIYYAALTNSGVIKLPVTQGAEYEISGTNEGGFIVTIKL